MRVTFIPAAGASSRMRGGDKLLEDVDGLPCLRTMVERAAQSAALVIVTLPALVHPRADALAGSAAQIIAVPDAVLGMSASLKAGISAVPAKAAGVMILPGDMPALEAADMARAWTVYETRKPIALQCTTQDGATGHPTLFSPKLLAEFDTLSGDRGAHGVISKHQDAVIQLALEGNRARCDLDTPEDWEKWRAERAI